MPSGDHAPLRYPRYLAPIIGALAGLYVTRYAPWFGMKPTVILALSSMGIGAIGGSAVWLMEAIEHGGCREVAPNAAITIVVLVLGSVLCWIPILGFGILSYGLYRSRWLDVNDWVLFPVSLIWFISGGLTLTVAIIAIAEIKW